MFNNEFIVILRFLLLSILPQRSKKNTSFDLAWLESPWGKHNKHRLDSWGIEAHFKIRQFVRLIIPKAHFLRLIIKNTMKSTLDSIRPTYEYDFGRLANMFMHLKPTSLSLNIGSI